MESGMWRRKACLSFHTNELSVTICIPLPFGLKCVCFHAATMPPVRSNTRSRSPSPDDYPSHFEQIRRWRLRSWQRQLRFCMITSQLFWVASVPRDWWLESDGLLRKLRLLWFHSDTVTIFIQAIVEKWKWMHCVVAHWLENSLTDCWNCWADVTIL